MKRSILSILPVLAFLGIALSGCASNPTMVPSTATTISSTATVIPPTDTPEPTSTATALPSPTQEPTAVPTIVPIIGQWNGTYTYPTGQDQIIILLVEKTDGTKFTGKMIWQPIGRSRGATLRMNGEYITDFSQESEAELARWGNLDDYKSGDKSGTWLKWTETEILDGRNYTVNGWYYAHIRSDGIMVAIYYFNDTETVPDSGTFILGLQ